MRREWIEITTSFTSLSFDSSPSMRREWIEIFPCQLDGSMAGSPSMRREWIEMSDDSKNSWNSRVSLHAEGVD